MDIDATAQHAAGQAASPVSTAAAPAAASAAPLATAPALQPADDTAGTTAAAANAVADPQPAAMTANMGEDSALHPSTHPAVGLKVGCSVNNDERMQRCNLCNNARSDASVQRRPTTGSVDDSRVIDSGFAGHLALPLWVAINAATTGKVSLWSDVHMYRMWCRQTDSDRPSGGTTTCMAVCAKCFSLAAAGNICDQDTAQDDMQCQAPGCCASICSCT